MFSGLVLLFALCALSQSWVHELSIYNGFDGTGDSITFTGKLAEVENWRPFLVQAQSVCHIGYWQFYRWENFRTTYMTTGHIHELYCYNVTFDHTIQSMRYLGPRDTSTATISLYNGTVGHEWDGEELIIEAPARNNFPFVPTAMVTTGGSRWTVYSNNDFTGNSTCVTSSTWEAVKTPYPILSVVKGCT